MNGLTGHVFFTGLANRGPVFAGCSCLSWVSLIEKRERSSGLLGNISRGESLCKKMEGGTIGSCKVCLGHETLAGTW